MESPLFRWSFETSKCRRTDSKKTFFESEKVVLNERNSQTEVVLKIDDGQIPFKKDAKGSSQEISHNGSPEVSERNNLPKGADSTPSNIYFGTQDDVAGKKRSPTFAHERKSNFDSGTEDFDSTDAPVQEPFSQSQAFRWRNGLIDVVSQNKFNNSSDATFFESVEKTVNQQNGATVPDRSDANPQGNFKVLTGLSDSQFNTYRIENESQTSSDATFFYTENKIAEPKAEPVERQRNASQEVKSSDHYVDEYPCHSVNECAVPRQNENAGKLEAHCAISRSETCSNDLSQDIVELIEDIPAYSLPVFNMADFDDFLRLLGTGTTNGIDHDDSNPSTISGMANSLGQFQLSSSENFSNTANSGLTESSEEASQVRAKLFLSPSNVVENKKRRRKEATSPQPIRPIGKPPKILKKEGTPLTPCHQMTLRNKTIQPTKEIRKSSTPNLNPDYLVLNSSNIEKVPPTTSKNMRKHINDPVEKRRKRILKSYRNISSDELVPGHNGKMRGQTKRMAELLCFDPVGETYETIIGQTSAQLRQDREYLLRVRDKLIDIIFDETPISKEEAENFQREVTERQQRILRCNQLHFCDKKVRTQVEDSVALCEKLQHQIKEIVDNSSGEIRNGTVPKSNYCLSQHDNFRVPGSPPKKRVRRTPGTNCQVELNVVSKKNNLKGVGSFSGRKKAPASQKTNPESDGPEFSRVLKAGTSGVISPPILRLSSPQLREETVPVASALASASGGENRSEEEDFVFVGPTEKRLPTGGCAHACSSLPKVVVDCGTNTDLVEPPEQKTIKKKSVDRETNTDPEYFGRNDQRIVLVDCGTNTEFYFSVDWKDNSKYDRKVPDADNKENVDPVVDLKNIQGIWLPRREDYAPSSYDHLLDDIFANPNAELPQELIDDLTWE